MVGSSHRIELPGLVQESTCHNPFAPTVQYFRVSLRTGKPVAQNISNISASRTGGLTSGDGAPWAANALWSYSALQTFVGLSGVHSASWLRATEGSWKGVSTLTVEGKLSWGANPLAASTPNDAFPDGERVNPLSEVALEFNPVYANGTGLGSGTGYAVLMSYSRCNVGQTCHAVYNYSSQAIVGLTAELDQRVCGHAPRVPDTPEADDPAPSHCG